MPPDKIITVQVKLRESEFARFPKAKNAAARVRLQCGLDPLAHGGIRAGGFEIGNKHNPANLSRRDATPRKRASARQQKP